MNLIANFVKTTLMGGLVVLLPLLILWLVVTEIADLVIHLATPIAHLFPSSSFENLSDPDVMAWILLLAASFVLGIAIKSQTLRRFGGWLEAQTIDRLPFYRPLKQLSRGLLGSTDADAFKGGLLSHSDGRQELVYIIEYIDAERATVLQPFAPASFTGSTLIVRRENLEELNASAGDISAVIGNWGVGTGAAISK